MFTDSTVKVRYQNTLADIWALQRALPLPWRFRMTFLIVTSCLPGTVVLALLGAWSALALAWAAQVLYLTWAYYIVYRRTSSHNRNLLVSNSLTFREQSVAIESPFGIGEMDWSLINRVRVSKEHLFLFICELEAFLIPRSAFGSSAEAATFAAAVHAHFVRSQGAGYIPYSPPESAEVTSEDTQGLVTALQVRFRNTGEELTTVRWFGLARSRPPWKRLATWAMLAGSLLLFCGLLMLSVVYDDLWLSSFGIFLLLELVGVALCDMSFAWRISRGVNRHRLDWQTLTVAASGFGLRAPRFEHRGDWSAIDEIGENERFVVFFLGKPRFLCVIPKMAFASRHECAQFVQLARQWKARAAHEASPGNAPPRVDTGNPYQSPNAI